ncbi:MAG: hypothetical protein Q7R68_02120 [Nitrospirales bacterium]|nr:hypothetical protein [Nitrospirales bacterium]
MPDLFRLRRFALIMGLILFAYSLADVEVNTNIVLSGVALKIRKPHVLEYGLLLASAYAMFRYWYYSTAVSISPAAARKGLQSGIFPLGSGKDLRGDRPLMLEQATLIFRRYFPRTEVNIDNAKVYQTTDLEGTRLGGFTMPALSKTTKLLNLMEDIDYNLPVLVNVVAILTYAAKALL